MNDSYVYPRSTAPGEDPEGVASDELVADIIVTAREQGLSKKHAELEALNVCHNKLQVKRVSEEVDAEKVALEQVDPAKCKDEAEFAAALGEKAKLLDATEWKNAVLEKYGVEKFGDLKEALPVAVKG
jgi:hypothetical protein